MRVILSQQREPSRRSRASTIADEQTQSCYSEERPMILLPLFLETCMLPLSSACEPSSIMCRRR